MFNSNPLYSSSDLIAFPGLKQKSPPVEGGDHFFDV
jgi:hypothetical protein